MYKNMPGWVWDRNLLLDSGWTEGQSSLGKLRCLTPWICQVLSDREIKGAGRILSLRKDSNSRARAFGVAGHAEPDSRYTSAAVMPRFKTFRFRFPDFGLNVQMFGCAFSPRPPFSKTPQPFYTFHWRAEEVFSTALWMLHRWRLASGPHKHVDGMGRTLRCQVI